MNNDDQFPHNEETWLDWTTRREQKIEADRRFARRVFVILATMITFVLLVHEAYLVLAK